MIPRRRRNESLSLDTRDTSKASMFVPTFMYPNVSSYRSAQMDLFIYSPSVMEAGMAGKQSIPVFGDNDQVGGKILLHPNTSPSGRLSISIEGAFLYHPSPNKDATEITPENTTENQDTPAEQQKYVFYSASIMVPVSPTPDPPPLPHRSSSRTTLREAFKAAAVRRRPSHSSLSTVASPVSPASPALPNRSDRWYPFTFELPRGVRSLEEIPPSFSSTSKNTLSDLGEYAVEYKILVSWEALDGSESLSVEIPFLLLPDADFQSWDGVANEQESWLEMPLRADRPTPFKCAVTLPTSVTFSRSSSIPYFVVFTTTPRSPSLAREIAADASISVSLQRQVSVIEQATLPPSPPQTPSGSSDDGSSGSEFSRVKLFRRVAPLISRGSPRSLVSEGNNDSPSGLFDVRDKPLPRLPTQSIFSETSTLLTSICIGFPKRPRQQQCEGQNHPSLDSQSSLPDGLLKSKILLNKQMVPSIDWAGLSVKYYFDVSVNIGQDEFRARVPIRLV